MLWLCNWKLKRNSKDAYPQVIQILEPEGKDFKTPMTNLLRKMEKKKKIDEIMENFTI